MSPATTSTSTSSVTPINRGSSPEVDLEDDPDNPRNNIVRKSPLKPAMNERRKAGARFTRRSQEFIEKCENLAEETSCWLFIAAQHPNATEPFYHYSSPKLIRDAKTDVEDITNLFNTLFTNLKTARQQDTLDLTKKLHDIEENFASTSQHLTDTLNEVAEHEKRIAEQEEQLNQYKALLAQQQQQSK
ncbi:hypothetical protein R3P38DRAFT_2774895 [Favolaschia claudopus]|uniref:Uncharacterized protein n=1 Tax=Favolaschia claudopus TaxID=2862362 RepID=A0AAW0BUF8_9AGAR